MMIPVWVLVIVGMIAIPFIVAGIGFILWLISIVRQLG